MSSNHIIEVRIEKINALRGYAIIERQSGEPRYYKVNGGSASSKRLDRVMNKEIKQFSYSLESYLMWGDGSVTLRFMRNTLPSELVTSDKELWLHILYPALFPMPEKLT